MNINLNLNEKEFDYLMTALANETCRLRDIWIIALEDDRTDINTNRANEIKQRIDTLNEIGCKLYHLQERKR